MAPPRPTAPKVGRWPVTPHRVDGETMEPSVSDPMAKGTQPADTAAAGPADEPLEPWSRFQGFLVVASYQTSPQARAPSDSLATRTAPASSSRSMTVAVSSIVWVLYGSAPHVVLVPCTASRSLAPYGTPCRGPRHVPASSSSSARRAAARARSSVYEMTACSRSSYRRRRCRASSVSSTLVTVRARSRWASSEMEAKASSSLEEGRSIGGRGTSAPSADGGTSGSSAPPRRGSKVVAGARALGRSCARIASYCSRFSFRFSTNSSRSSAVRESPAIDSAAATCSVVMGASSSCSATCAYRAPGKRPLSPTAEQASKNWRRSIDMARPRQMTDCERDSPNQPLLSAGRPPIR